MTICIRRTSLSFSPRSVSLPILTELSTGEPPAVKPAQKMRQAFLQKFHRFTVARTEHVTSPEPSTGLKLWFEPSEPSEAVAKYVKPKRRPVNNVLRLA